MRPIRWDIRGTIACRLVLVLASLSAGAAQTARAGEPAAEKDRPTWALRKPSWPAVPRVRDGGRVRTPVDAFVLARLEAAGLALAPEADRATLVRRLSFDLLGLPPSPEEIDAFTADARPDAYERLVERLLASLRYCERWGRHWLDLVRYTDDLDEAWRYRDWVVRAFNTDLPYDQFLREQIAGDLLPGRQPGTVNADGIVATTVLSLGPWGGIDRKRRLADIVDDQIDTIGRAFLGMTVACARCHDHKFDPITTADYYALAGIFFSSRIIPDKGYLSHGTARLRVPLVGPAEVERYDRLTAQIQEKEHHLEAAVEKHYSAFLKTLLPRTADYLAAAWEYRHRPAGQAAVSVEQLAAKRKLYPWALAAWVEYLGAPRMGDYRLLDMAERNFDGEAGVEAWRVRAERPWWAVNTTNEEVGIETFTLPPHTISINPGETGGAVAWQSPIAGTVRVSGRLTDADPADGVGVSWVIDHTSAAGRRELSSGSLPSGARTLEQGRTPERLAAVAVKPGDRIVLHVQLRQGDAHYDITNVELTIATLDGSARWDLPGDTLGNFLEANPHRDARGHSAVWHFLDAAGSNRMKRMPAVEPLLARFQAAAEKVGAEKAAEEFQRAIDAAGPDSPPAEDLSGTRSPLQVKYRNDVKYLPPEARAVLDRLAGELKALRDALPPLPCANGVQEGGLRFSPHPGFQDVPIHLRGSSERFGRRVPRGVPRVLAGGGPLGVRAGSGRQELAQWVGSEDNPLAARVLVNRIWQHHFGEGIVRTPSNFGALGERPTHPELLDHLARHLIGSGWSVKAVHRLVLLSAAYRQSSRAPRESLIADPENRLFSRMNRRRLEAEALRDALLAVSGSLDPRPGGPAVPDPLSSRRMLYLRASRGDRSGFGALFDAADPSIQVEKRAVSTAAPQALFLMNNRLVADRVGLLVRRPEVAGSEKPEERIQALYRLLFGRRAEEEEVSAGRDFVAALTEKSAPGKSDGPAPLGPWEAYAQALLLSNEFLFVD